jgi:peptide/nickel transport system substrate-binding protein
MPKSAFAISKEEEMLRKLTALFGILVAASLVTNVWATAFPRSETVFVAQLSGTVGVPSNFNRWVGWAWWDRGLHNLALEALWTVDYVRGEVINGLAAAPPDYNEDFTQVTIKLREGVYWSDGVEFTADDVVFTIETIRANPGLSYNLPMQMVERVYAADRHTVVVELKEPDSRFHAHFLDRWGALHIMPKHVWEPVAAEGTAALLAFEFNPPVSSGPYVLHSYDPAGFWTAWERRDDWDRTPTGMLYGQPAPRYVVFRSAGDPTVQVMALARHELDVALPLTLEAMRAGLIMAPYAITFYPHFPWADNLDPAITGLTFNTLRPPFDNRDVRWALTLAIDIVSYSATAYDGKTLLSALHTPTLPLYAKHYFGPMQEWLKDFALAIDDGKEPATFNPYDPEAPFRLAEFARARGHEIPEDIIGTFGFGWWKHAPDIAARLLEKHGFTRDANGRWLLPDGTPWRFTVMTDAAPGHPMRQNAFAAVHEWRRFGIDVEALTLASGMAAPRNLRGDFYVTTAWPATEPWGGHVDLFRTFDPWNSAYLEPVLGEPHYAHASRWTDPRMDEVIAKLRTTDWTDTERIVEIGREGFKILVEEMPSIPTFNYTGPELKSTAYWTNWPTSENPYNVSLTHWPNFKYMLPFLRPTGR